MTNGSPQSGDSRRDTYNYPPKSSWKDIAILITLILNLSFLVATVFGGMKWVTEVNTQIAVVTARQAIVLTTIDKIQNFDIRVAERHAIEDALYPKTAEKIRQGIGSPGREEK